MTPRVIFGGVNLAMSIAGYFGLIENVNNNVQKLLHQSFKSAISNLQASLNASEPEMKTFYIKQALVEFNAACSVEINENLISSLLGKAVCQHFLGDYINRDLTMEEIKNVNLSLSEKTKAISKTVLKQITGFGNFYNLYKCWKGENPYTSDYNERLDKFESYKQLVLATK